MSDAGDIPDVIHAGHMGDWFFEDPLQWRKAFVSKDMADDLAQLVEMAMRGKFRSEDGARALARYNAATEGK